MPVDKEEASTYSVLDDVRTLVPHIDDFLGDHFQDQTTRENYITRCLELAKEWIDNELEAEELNTFAKSNFKRLAEANYASYLILRGVIRGERAENNAFVKSYKEDAEAEIKKIRAKSAVVPGHSSRTESFSRNRLLLKKNLRWLNKPTQ